MSMSDAVGYPTPPPASGQRQLRRNRSNRMAAGVCGGLGDYFNVDPVLFRVLFGTAAFFGGAGILAYLLAWAAIPEAGTEHAPIDGVIAWAHRGRLPMWIVAVVAGLLLWAFAFSWWAPHHFFPVFPVVAIVILLVVFYGRREMQAAPPANAPVDLTKGERPTDQLGQPSWVRDARSWYDEAREAGRLRRRRAAPVRIAMLVTLAATLTVLGIIDAFSGIWLSVYFWAALGILGVGLLTGLVLRRTPLSMLWLVPPAVVGAIAFGGSHASLHDGIGQREWKPTNTPASDYRLAFGQGTLDLTRLAQQSTARQIDVTMGAGQVKIIVPRDMNVTVLANIHFGQLEVNGGEVASTRNAHVGLSQVVSPATTARGTPITVDVHLADGNISVERR